ncbi:MAG: Trypsin [Methanomassiliicoccales archaeon PtaU1.Bin124]|nr:MAG: Trypsin [Methanomassiliicoccales archaeon PtaU1.Bin124]
MAKHESVSSEQPLKKNDKGAEEDEDDEMHGAVSSEAGGAGGEGIETDEEAMESDNAGIGGIGELEYLPEFNPERAYAEGMRGETVPLPETEQEIPMCCPKEREMETVCGADDRVKITNVGVIPWRWICQLIITTSNNKKYRCTGWFIGPHTVMTAGHCVYMHGEGGWVKEIEVIPCMNGTQRPFGSQIGRSFRSVVGWTKNKDENYDYGAIILPDNSLGNRVGWFGFCVLPDLALINLLVNTAGYPGDKPYGTKWFNAGRITRITNRKVYYMNDTYGGQSGSPVWRYCNGHRLAIAIHAYGGCPNSGARIVKPVFDNMVKWKA